MTRGGPLTLRLPPEDRWLPLAEAAVRLVGREGDLSEVLVDMAASSLLEACEEYVRVAGSAGVADPLELGLEVTDEALVLRLDYGESVPLNPHETGSYTAPNLADDDPTARMDALWLHLIRRRMDRVRFTMAGDRRCLEMVKYRREQGKDRRFWLMGLAPALAPGVALSLQPGGTASDLPTGGLLQAGEGGSVITLDSVGAFVASRLDGRCQFQEIYMEYVDRVGMISPAKLASIFEGLESAGMLAGSRGAQPQGWRRLVRKLLNPTLTLPHADAVVGFLHRQMGFLVGPVGVLLLLLLGLSGLVAFAWHRGLILGELGRLHELLEGHPWRLLLVYLLLGGVAVVHELGHALACKSFGGRVDRMGIMFYLAFFMFFCDVSAAWNFPERSRRAWVSLAGPLTTFAALGAATWLTAAWAGDTALWGTTWALVTLACFFGLAMNFNPFIKMDAYYLLSDLAGLPNLRQRSFRFLTDRLLRRRRGPSAALTDHAVATPRMRALFWTYGLLGSVMTLLFLAWPFMRLVRALLARDSSMALLLVSVVVVTLILARLAHQAFNAWQARSHQVFRL
jgi:putative peptide zinc metalloprotease protein